MESLARRLPPVSALIAFEAVVRCGTITAAAAELGTSQPAVSQRLRALEGHLGLTLFVRAGRGLRPTAAALHYAEELAVALGRMAAATEAIGALRRPAPLIISAPFGFAHLWLAPLLPALEAAFAGTAFLIRAEDDPRALGQRKPDLEVRFGPADAMSLGAHYLLDEIVQPVCSPAFAALHGLDADATAERIAALPLLHLDEEEPRWCDWPRWFAAHGLRDFRPAPRLYYNNYPLLQQAAADGKGLALGWYGLVDPLIEAGTLVGRGPVYLRRRRGYWLHTANPAETRRGEVAAWIAARARPVADALVARFADLPAPAAG